MLAGLPRLGAVNALAVSILLATCVRKGEREYPLALAELEFRDLDPVSAEWLEVYRYWLGERD